MHNISHVSCTILWSISRSPGVRRETEFYATAPPSLFFLECVPHSLPVVFFASSLPPPLLFSAHLHLFSVLIIREGGGRRRGIEAKKGLFLIQFLRLFLTHGENERRKNPTLYYGLWGGAKVSFSFNLSQKYSFKAALARWEITVNERF